MLQAWKYDVDNNGTPFNSSSYKNMIKTYYYGAIFTTSGTNREVHAGQYGYSGVNWGLMWLTYNTPGAFYTNYNALAEYNA
jgi:hypothetical protein